MHNEIVNGTFHNSFGYHPAYRLYFLVVGCKWYTGFKSSSLSVNSRPVTVVHSHCIVVTGVLSLYYVTCNCPE